jgi:hypothetical protein
VYADALAALRAMDGEFAPRRAAAAAAAQDAVEAERVAATAAAAARQDAVDEDAALATTEARARAEEDAALAAAKTALEGMARDEAARCDNED